MQHRDPLGEADHHFHVVLDHQHRLALVRVHRPDQLDELRHVLHRHAGHRLVEQENALVRGEQHRELELALVSVREQPGGPRITALEPDPLDRPGRARDRVPDGGRPPPDPHRPAHRRLRRQAHVLVHRQQREDVRDLERAADARLRTPVGRLLRDVDAVELDGAARRPAQAGDEVEECRLPRPVRADHGKQLTVEDLELDIGDDRGAADVESEHPRSEDWRCSHAFEATFGSYQPRIGTTGGAVSNVDAVPSTVAARRPFAVFTSFTRNIGCSIA